MKLGTYVEVLNYVDDSAAAGAYYSKLGLVAVGDDVYTDGRYHLRLLIGEGENPSLRYYGSELDALKESGLELVDNTLTSPAGVKILLDAAPAPRQLPHDSVAKAPDITRLGKFGELSVMTDDLESEGAFWESAGYETLGKYTEPMPWGIWCDEMYLIGIHQYGMIEPFSITHFDPQYERGQCEIGRGRIQVGALHGQSRRERSDAFHIDDALRDQVLSVHRGHLRGEALTLYRPILDSEIGMESAINF